MRLIGGPNKNKDLKPVDNTDPIRGSRMKYDDDYYRPPGYDDPNRSPCIGCNGPYNSFREEDKTKK
ncbi:hypothetical protein DC498_22190 [Terrimonas sp.]|nr:hypothetical protein DC498_22190 [Terrimonas sp.]